MDQGGHFTPADAHHAGQQADGKVVYRCAAEPIDDYLKKGGKLEDTVGRKCICNGLIATIGLGQVRSGESEPAIVTAGVDVVNVHRLLKPGRDSYSADDVLDYILSAAESRNRRAP